MTGKTNLTQPLKRVNHYFLPPSPMHDLIISPHVKHPPKIAQKKFVPPCKAFLRKKFPYTL